MTYSRQVEVASDGVNGIDFELVDNSDGKGVQIIPKVAGFVIPTEAEIDAAETEADAIDAELIASSASIKARPSGVAPPELEARLTALEAIVAELVTRA